MDWAVEITTPLFEKRAAVHTLTRSKLIGGWRKIMTRFFGMLPAISFESSAYYFDFLMPMAEVGIA